MERRRHERRQEPGSQPTSGRDFGRALDHGLRLPLAALRASMENLARELETAREARPLEGVLEEVDLLGRNVRDLLDYATPPRPAPLPCTIGEILHGALQNVPGADRVAVSRQPGRITVDVDGPLVARTLSRLVENSLEAGAQSVLVSARREDDRLELSVVDDGPGEFDPSLCEGAFRSSKPNHLGLGLELVRRDVELLHGTFSMRRSRLGTTLAELAVPTRLPAEVERR